MTTDCRGSGKSIRELMFLCRLSVHKGALTTEYYEQAALPPWPMPPVLCKLKLSAFLLQSLVILK